MTKSRFKKIAIVDETDAGDYLAIAYANSLEILEAGATNTDMRLSADWGWIIVTSTTKVVTLGIKYRLEIYAGK